MREQGSGTRRAVQQVFDRHKLTVNVRLEFSSNEAIKQSVMGGLGISVLSLHCLRPDYQQGELTILNVKEFPIPCRWYIVHPSGKQLSVLAEAFLKHLLLESQSMSLKQAS